MIEVEKRVKEIVVLNKMSFYQNIYKGEILLKNESVWLLYVTCTYKMYQFAEFQGDDMFFLSWLKLKMCI